MRLVCEHCGRPFTITADQLGLRGRCPHCRGAIQLPRAAEDGEDQARMGGAAARMTRWLDSSLSSLVSLVFHMALLLTLALVRYQGRSGEGPGEDVLIGVLPAERLELVDTGPEQLAWDALEAAAEEPPEMDAAAPELAPAAPPDAGPAELAALTLAPSGAADGAVEFGPVGAASGAGGGGWDGLLRTLRRDGLDIVLAFDSTGSMSGEIVQVKRQLRRIGATLLALVPKARISICTYRDARDDYVVRGLPLTGDLQLIEDYLAGVRAGGGGDEPESVHEGLRWAVEENEFRPRARKVILLFGDAPPHEQDLPVCLRIASEFHSQQQGVVSTVTCRKRTRIPAFVRIAEAGGGEAFLTSDERQIMTQLMVLAFGSQYRSKVLEAFQLMDAQ